MVKCTYAQKRKYMVGIKIVCFVKSNNLSNTNNRYSGKIIQSAREIKLNYFTTLNCCEKLHAISENNV